ncbi:hypothetical protein BTN49_0706 [Candidatus Enterovibrio escicola]|uniref:Uncharacterized protein n=1 Tax=Candidatus Enterovibrio escicola TaxID=1927127 RepID=A0A2A5T6E9_9GAMM|nr:hypothetical protein BTN49_0706 [Candidatus Enterovibrio escacola]
MRYYGLQATASFKKWYEVIARAAGDLVNAMMIYTKGISYVEIFEEVSGRNPLKMCVLWELVRFSHPKHGVFFDLFASDSG